MPAKIPLEDFFRNPEKTRFQISPNGDYLSYMAPWQNRLNVFTRTIDSDEEQRVTNETERSVAGYFWGSNNRIVFLKDKGGDENFHLYSVSVDGKDERDLTPFDGITVQIIDDLEESDDEVIIGMNQRNKEIFDAYRLNIHTGVLALEAENPGNITDWITDHDGEIRIAITTDGVNNSFLHREKKSDPFKVLLTTNFRESVSPLFFTFDNKQLYALSNLTRDKAAIVLFDLDEGKEIEVLFQHGEVDLGGLSYSRKRKVLTNYFFMDWKRQTVFLDPETEKIYKRIEKELGDDEIVLTSQNKEETKFLVRTHSDRSLGAYYLYDVQSDQLTHLAEVSPWLKKEVLATMKPVTYTSRDGFTIHGYLTLPIDKHGAAEGSAALPVVVNPHGGPWVRDAWGFNPEVQFLANRGYAVFQINYRGSTGYGKKFWQSSFKQWGKKMQDDISDGVKWLIDEGIADKKRIAIYGGSYGGYATLAGLTFTPDLYCCGIDYVGVSNLFTFMNTIPPYWKPYLEMMYEMVGNPTTEKELLHEASPVFHVDKIKVPLLVAQGANDPRVNINESNQIVEALKKKGVEVEYIVKDNEGHGFHNEENRFDFYRAMEKFLAAHLGG
ncbi:MAG TPA: S9 family peptidase [Chitinophagales bacterium]|nr:S9 family peptidase [Chitinophagales bacterium]